MPAPHHSTPATTHPAAPTAPEPTTEGTPRRSTITATTATGSESPSRDTTATTAIPVTAGPIAARRRSTPAASSPCRPGRRPASRSPGNGHATSASAARRPHIEQEDRAQYAALSMHRSDTRLCMGTTSPYPIHHQQGRPVRPSDRKRLPASPVPVTDSRTRKPRNRSHSPPTPPHPGNGSTNPKPRNRNRQRSPGSHVPLRDVWCPDAATAGHGRDVSGAHGTTAPWRTIVITALAMARVFH